MTEQISNLEGEWHFNVPDGTYVEVSNAGYGRIQTIDSRIPLKKLENAPVREGRAIGNPVLVFLKAPHTVDDVVKDAVRQKGGLEADAFAKTNHQTVKIDDNTFYAYAVQLYCSGPIIKQR